MVTNRLENLYSLRFDEFNNQINELIISEDVKSGLFEINNILFHYALKLNTNKIKSKVSFIYVLDGLRYRERIKIIGIIRRMFIDFDLCNGNTKEIDVEHENPVYVLENLYNYDFWEIDFSNPKDVDLFDMFVSDLKIYCRDLIKCIFIFCDDNLLESFNNKIEKDNSIYKDYKYKFDYVFKFTSKDTVYKELEDNLSKKGYKCNFNANDIMNINEYRDNEIYIEDALIKNNILKNNNELSFNELNVSNLNDNYIKLNDMIGLKNVKKEIKNLEYLLKFYKDINKKNHSYLNIIFKGNPGTGKTTVARNYADLLYNLGYIKTNNLVEIVPTDLMGEYVGETRDTTRKILKKAKGGVLFIDEAYNLNTAKEYNGGTFMREAVVELLKYMEDKNNVVIYAGYKLEMEELLDINPGFRSRISSIINFDDYTTDELIEIFKYDMKKYDLKCDNKFLLRLKKKIEKDKNKKNFGNARYIDNLLNKILVVHAANVYDKKTDLYTLIVNDLDIEEDEKSTFGFSIEGERG